MVSIQRKYFNANFYFQTEQGEIEVNKKKIKYNNFNFAILIIWFIKKIIKSRSIQDINQLYDHLDYKRLFLLTLMLHLRWAEEKQWTIYWVIYKKDIVYKRFLAWWKEEL